MSHLGPHLNIVNLLGACTKHGEPPLNHQEASSFMTHRGALDTFAAKWDRFLELWQKFLVGKLSLSSPDVPSGGCGLVSRMGCSRRPQLQTVHMSGVLGKVTER